MKTCRYLLPLLATLLLPFMAEAADSLKDQVSKILRLKLPPEEVADSASKVISRYETENQATDSGVYAECVAALDELLLPYAVQKGLSDSSMAYIYDERGRLKLARGSEAKNDADADFVKGIAYAEKAGDWFRLGRLLEHQGFNEIKYGDQVKGFDLAKKAIDAYRKSETNADRYITRCYYMQAVVYLQLGDMEGMGKLLSDMEKFVPKEYEDNRLFHLYNLYSVQEVYYATLRNNASDRKEKKKYADLFNKTNLKTVLLIDSAPAAWRQTSVNPCWNYFNRASMFVNTYDHPPMDSVIYYCDKALGVDHHNKGGEELEIMTSTAMVIAEGWMKNGVYSKASAMLQDALDKIKAQKDVNNLVQERVQIYELFRDVAAHFGRMEDALAYSDSVRMLEQERFSIEKATAVKDLEVKYETKETQLALAQSEARRSSILMWLFAASGLILIGAILFVVYAGRQRRRRMQKELEFAALRADIGRQYVEGLESERQRMSRELHDGVCNDLLAIQMNLNRGKPIEETAGLIDSCRESVRRISHELMPPEFTYATLDEVVRFFVRKQMDDTSRNILISYTSAIADAHWEDVPDAVALEVYRVAQEAVGNSIKHSGCSNIEVYLRLHLRHLSLTVTDDGSFRTPQGKGIGLDSIRKRAESIGGSVTIDSIKNGSTMVTLEVNIVPKAVKKD